MKLFRVHMQKPVPNKRVDPLRYRQVVLVHAKSPKAALRIISETLPTVWPLVEIVEETRQAILLVA